MVDIVFSQVDPFGHCHHPDVIDGILVGDQFRRARSQRGDEINNLLFARQTNFVAEGDFLDLRLIRDLTELSTGIGLSQTQLPELRDLPVGDDGHAVRSLTVVRSKPIGLRLNWLTEEEDC